MNVRLTIVAAAIGIALVAPADGLAASGSWRDESGDAAAGVPDVETVSVDAGSDDLIRWTIHMPNLAGLRPGVFIDVKIDTDGQMSTGSAGIDHLLRVNGTSKEAALFAWNGSSFVAAEASGLSVTADFPLRLTLSRRSLGNPSTLWFWIRAWNYVTGSEPACCYDDAPSTGFYKLELGSGSVGGWRKQRCRRRLGRASTAPTAARLLLHRLRRRGGGGSGSGAGASGSNTSGSGSDGRAGSTAPASARTLAVERLTTARTRTLLVVRLSLIRDATGARVRSGRVHCRATAGALLIRVRTSRFEGGSAVCRFALTTRLRGRAIVGVVTVESGSSLTTRFRVRGR